MAARCWWAKQMKVSMASRVRGVVPGLLLTALLLCAATLLAQAPQAQDAPKSDAATKSEASAKPTTVESHTQKARRLLDEMIAALGGEAWLNYANIEQQGRTCSFFHGKPTTAGTLLWRYFEYPGKEHLELSRQRDVIYIYKSDANGEVHGYEITYKGTAAVEAKDVEEFVRRRDFSLERAMREWLGDPRTVILYVGQSVADQQPVEVVSLLNEKNQQVEIGIDLYSHLPINLRYHWRGPDKYLVTDEVVFGNYHRVQGIQTPYTITRLRDGEITSQRFFNRVLYNQKLAPDFFDATVTYDPATYTPREKKKP